MAFDMNTKVPAEGKKPAKAMRQPVVGKLNNGSQSMPGSKGKGQSVTTAPSNPIQGATKSKDTAMGNGSVVDGFVK